MCHVSQYLTVCCCSLRARHESANQTAESGLRCGGGVVATSVAGASCLWRRLRRRRRGEAAEPARQPVGDRRGAACPVRHRFPAPTDMARPGHHWRPCAFGDEGGGDGGGGGGSGGGCAYSFARTVTVLGWSPDAHGTPGWAGASKVSAVIVHRRRSDFLPQSHAASVASPVTTQGHTGPHRATQGHTGPHRATQGHTGPHEGHTEPHEGHTGPHEGHTGSHEGHTGPHEGRTEPPARARGDRAVRGAPGGAAAASAAAATAAAAAATAASGVPCSGGADAPAEADGGWPNVLDDGSVNGSTRIGEVLPLRRHVRLADGDVLVFGGRGGDCVLLHVGRLVGARGGGGVGARAPRRAPLRRADGGRRGI